MKLASSEKVGKENANGSESIKNGYEWELHEMDIKKNGNCKVCKLHGLMAALKWKGIIKYLQRMEWLKQHRLYAIQIAMNWNCIE